MEAVLNDENVCVVTPTASGKTMCYNVPVLNRLIQNPNARALYLFPTKALSQDQVHELKTIVDDLEVKIGTYTFDGDTPASARKAVRSAGHIVVTNPDMLHAGILPHHTIWIRLFENLEYVVIDELHHYRGVFGSHLANIVRRLKRICAFYGSNPTFICCSETAYWFRLTGISEPVCELIQQSAEFTSPWRIQRDLLLPTGYAASAAIADGQQRTFSY